MPAGWLLILVVLGGLVNASLATAFYRRGVMNINNVLFDADAAKYLKSISSGENYLERRHPLVTALLAPVAYAGRLLPGPELENRRRIAILLPALMGALKTWLLILLCRRIRLSAVCTALLCLLDTVCWSRLIFSSIPECYGMSALLLTWMAFLAVRSRQEPRSIPWAQWVACGVLAIGVTVTNIVPFVLFLWSALWTPWQWRSLLRPVWTVAGASMAAGVLAVALYAFSAPWVRPAAAADNVPAPASEAGPKQEHLFYHLRPEVMARYPLMLTYAFTGPAPGVRAVSQSGLPFFVMDFDWSVRVLPYCLLVLPWLLWAVIEMPRFGSDLTAPAFAGVLVVGFNFAMHLVFSGTDLSLFTLHWQPSLLLLFAGLTLAAGRRFRWWSWCLGAVTLAIALINATNLSQIFARLS